MTVGRTLTEDTTPTETFVVGALLSGNPVRSDIRILSPHPSRRLHKGTHKGVLR